MKTAQPQLPQNNFFEKLIFAIVAAVVLVFLISFFASCSTHKALSLHTRTVDSTSVTHSEAVDKATVDSNTSAREVYLNSYDSAFYHFSGAGIAFYPDTIFHTLPVTIAKNSDGSITVNPGGRQIKNISLQSSDTGKVKTVFAGSIANETSLHKSDSGSQIKDTKVKVVSSEKDKAKTTDKPGRFIWWAIGALIVIVLLYLNRKRIASLITGIPGI